jgi:hypothetical protein
MQRSSGHTRRASAVDAPRCSLPDTGWGSTCLTGNRKLSAGHNAETSPGKLSRVRLQGKKAVRSGGYCGRPGSVPAGSGVHACEKRIDNRGRSPVSKPVAGHGFSGFSAETVNDRRLHVRPNGPVVRAPWQRAALRRGRLTTFRGVSALAQAGGSAVSSSGSSQPITDLP